MAARNGWIVPVLLFSVAFVVRRISSSQDQDFPRDLNSSLVVAETIENIAEQVIGTHYDCRLQYGQLPESFTRLSVHHLLVGSRETLSSKWTAGDRELQSNESVIREIDFNFSSKNSSSQQMDQLHLDPSLPCVFFTNGFNHDGNLDGTWMKDVASVYLSRYLTPRAERSKKRTPRPGANVIFLNWHMEGLLAENALSVIPIYYKTMANYEIIVGRFKSAIQQIIDHLDELRSCRSGAGKESRKDYYAKFRFFGHSLGSHILAHALNGVHKLKPELKFDQIYGLDPAIPCFSNHQQGLTASGASGVTREVVILHSNAGILGASSDRGQFEIVLNGGTFQPNCSFFDLSCHHVRATDIFRYTDDDCKMVAYKCNKYEQFKLGACETCDIQTTTATTSGLPVTANGSSPAVLVTPNCVLVNLDEQNEDSELIESIVASSNEQVRQLADNYDDENDVYDAERAASVGLRLANEQNYYLRNAKPEYHFVNTNPKYQEIVSKSHCLQHYQLRLLTLDHSGAQSSVSDQVVCPLKLNHGEGISIQLFHEPVDSLLRRPQPRQRDQVPELTLTTIIDNQLHTGLGTFGGKPRLFVGAIIDNIDLKSWSECSIRQQQQQQQSNQTSVSWNHPKEFVLDIAFMSHTKKIVRHAFSSVLCAQWPPIVVGNDSDERAADAGWIEPGHLMLNLCRQSELANVSNSIDELIKQVKFQNQFESWHVILLNSLFSLFSGWEPL